MAILNRENDDSSVENRNTIRFQIHPILPNSSFCCVSVELWQRGPLQDVVWKQSFPHPWTVCLTGFNAPHWILPAVCLLNSKGTLLNGSIIVLRNHGRKKNTCQVFAALTAGQILVRLNPKNTDPTDCYYLFTFVCIYSSIYLSACPSIHPILFDYLSIHINMYNIYIY